MEQLDQKEGKDSLVNLAYILGTSLVIAAIIYFFASNWGGLERGEKVGLITLLLAGFYGLSFLLERLLPGRPLVWKLAFLSGAVSFGVSVALLGQVYNSHADSYVLFLIWLIPVILFSITTHFQMFYILSYILVHLTFAFYLFPTSISFYRTEGEMLLFLLLLAGLNGCLFVLLRRKKWKLPILQYGSFLMFHLIFQGITMREVFEAYALLLNGLFILLFGLMFYWFSKNHLRTYTAITAISVAFYCFKWLFTWMIEENTEWLFLFIISISITLVGATVYFLNWLKKKRDHEEIDRRSEKLWWQKLMIEVVSIVSSLLATAAFVGLTSLLFSFFPKLYIILALLLLIMVIVFGEKWNEVINHTLIYSGLLLAIFNSFDHSTLLSLLFLFLTPVIWKKTYSTVVRLFVYFGANLFILFTSIQYSLTIEQHITILLFLNGVMYIASSMLGSQNKNRMLLQHNALFYSLLFGFILTFLFEDHHVIYVLANSVFFILTTYLGFRSIQKDNRTRATIVLLFWFAYLVYKYYDIVWKLLHKSFALLIIGFVFLIAATMFDKELKKGGTRKRQSVMTKIPVVITIILQLAFTFYQYNANENMLANGELITLKLEPLDPRSLLQGDYVRLNYDISQIKELTDQFQPGEKLTLVLSPNEDGYHDYAGVYQYKGEFNIPYELKDLDILMNAKIHSWDHIVYGIESYFIEEGTGAEVEQKATHALVKVAANGNAILVGVE
ncbi:DUF2157 domain-containing protein [bacterium LRH843]|nr:DUF2157 domain-containing protein [bacterium LRH843]